MRKFILILLLAVVNSTWAGDFDDGVAAYLRKDYEAAQQGDSSAQFNIGLMYEEGYFGVPQDYKKAVKWYRQAAKQGHANAQLYLGLMYEEGHGVTQDYEKAVKWYRLAAKQGDAKAQVNLGTMHYSGQGVLQDYVRAHMWFNLAVAAGLGRAGKNRDLSAGRMTPQQIAEAQKMTNECLANNYKDCD